MLWTSIFGSKKAKFSATGSLIAVPKLRTMLSALTDSGRESIEKWSLINVFPWLKVQMHIGCGYRP